MRTQFIEFIRDSWFAVLYVAWGTIPLLVVWADIRPDWTSAAWVSAAVLYVAAGLGVLVLMFARHSARRIRLADVTVASAASKSEGIPERLDRYRARLVWERVDGILTVALPFVLGLLVLNGILVVALTQQAGDWQTLLLAAVAVTVGAVLALVYRGLSSGQRRVERIVHKMGDVTTTGSLVAGLSRDLETVGVAIGAPRIPFIAILESPAYNAFAVGRNAESGVIVVTRPLADALSANGRLALLTHLTLSLQKRGLSVPSDDTRQLKEQLLDLETVQVTGEPDGMLELLRVLSDRETDSSAWYRGGNPIPAAPALIWPLIDLEDREGQTADRVLALDEVLRAEGYYVDTAAMADSPDRLQAHRAEGPR